MNDLIKPPMQPSWRPAAHLVETIAEQFRTAGMLQRAVTALNGSAQILALVPKLPGFESIGPMVQTLIDDTPLEWAQECIDSEFEAIHRLGLLSLWFGLEAAIKETAVAVLSNTRGLATTIQLRIRPRPSPIGTSDHAVLFDLLVQHCRRESGGFAGYVSALHAVNVDACVQDWVITTLDELKEVRNCFAHRNGIADARLLKRAPNFNVQVGERIAVGRSQFLRYFDAAIPFSTELLRAAQAQYATHAAGDA